MNVMTEIRPTLDEAATTYDKVTTLQELQSKLNARDREFAGSLIKQYHQNTRPLSDKQMYWVGVLTTRATGADTKPAAIEVGSIG
jgi:hypothetical protein